MTTKVASSATIEAPSVAADTTKRATETQAKGGYRKNRPIKNGDSLPKRAYPTKRPAKNRRQVRPRLPLPTFPLEVGYREVYDPVTRIYQQLPLTLRDILYPQEEDIGVVKMVQGPLHDQWSRWLADMLQAYLVDEGWLIMHDVLINWNLPGVPKNSPDVTLIYEGQLPAEGNESYHVGRDGPLPDFVIEITSDSTRAVDLGDKTLAYAAVGVPEFLIIDRGTPVNEPWQLLGYRLGEQPMYEIIAPDPDGRITFAEVGLQFEVVGRERINLYDLATGDRLLTPAEQKTYADSEAARAKQETTRADNEAAARLAAEARIRELEVLLRQAGLQP
jgi:Uma2 family endonuclease